MSPAELPISTTPAIPVDDPPVDRTPEETDAEESHNLLVLAGHHILLRTAWIFKTESVIMPAFLDTISGAGWVRGCLPWLNRLGQSLPPLLYAERLRDAPRKKWSLVWTTLAMSVPFLMLAVIWFSVTDHQQPWFPAVFLVLYLLFFSMTGLNQLSFGTIQGKLIRPERRGRLMGLSGIVGSVCAITCAMLLLRRWLQYEDQGFGFIFTFVGFGFVLAGLCCLLVVEPEDDAAPPRERKSIRDHFRNAQELLKADRHFRGLVFVAVLFVTSLFLFPHYQALGRKSPHWEMSDLMIWVVMQNISAGVFSLIAGAIADRFGNRVTLRLLITGAALSPVVAILLATPTVAESGDWFWVTFLILGAVPVTFRTLSNYTLELAPQEAHPQYLSTLKICLAVPFFLSPFVGLLIETVGFEPVFLTISCLVGLAAVRTFSLHEPRHQHSESV